MPRDVMVAEETATSVVLTVKAAEEAAARPDVPPITHWTIEYQKTSRLTTGDDSITTTILSVERG